MIDEKRPAEQDASPITTAKQDHLHSTGRPDLDRWLAERVGFALAGACQECEAFQQLYQPGPGELLVEYYHDVGCPFLEKLMQEQRRRDVMTRPALGAYRKAQRAHPSVEPPRVTTRDDLDGAS